MKPMFPSSKLTSVYLPLFELTYAFWNRPKLILYQMEFQPNWERCHIPPKCLLNAWCELKVSSQERLGELGRVVQLGHSFLIIGGRVSCQFLDENLNHFPIFSQLFGHPEEWLGTIYTLDPETFVCQKLNIKLKTGRRSTSFCKGRKWPYLMAWALTRLPSSVFPIASIDAKRNFSLWKYICSNCRGSLIEENLSLAVAANSFYASKEQNY